MSTKLPRRGFLKAAGTTALALSARKSFAASSQPLPIAAVVTCYTENSHADVIVGKILEGYEQNGGPGPNLRVASVYVDQTPRRELSRKLAEKHGFRLAETIDEALTLGTDRLQVAGVLSIGEHGDYPFTERTGQHQYPRRRFFDEIVACYERTGESAPVFNDKHLSYRFDDARHMVDAAKEVGFPLMAGSSLPVAWRRPSLALPMGSQVQEAVVVGYGPLEAYGFHALETLQCMVERRRGGETGVASVRALDPDQIRNEAKGDHWPAELVEAAIRTMPEAKDIALPVDYQRLRRNAGAFRIEYRDGLKATVLMANGIVRQFAFAASIADRSAPAATWFELQDAKPYGHFAYLVKAIEQMIQTGRSPYPVERTLLTTGVLDVAMHSLADQGRRIQSPELTIDYRAADWPFANQESIADSILGVPRSPDRREDRDRPE